LRNGWAPSTLYHYKNVLRRFQAFCEMESVPQDLRFPSDERVLCAFAASSAGSQSGSTARNNIAALKAWHHANGLEWEAGRRLQYILNGVDSLTPSSSVRRQRRPVTAQMLGTLSQKLDATDELDITTLAIALTAFWGQCRLGEILPTSLASSIDHLPRRSGIITTFTPDKAFKIHLPRTKTKKHGDEIILVAQRTPIDPVRTIQIHLDQEPAEPSSLLFSKTTERHQRITKTAFLKRCNEVWAKEGIPRVTGHSFRIGGTAELLLAGVDPAVVKATGRWSSDAFQKYWRSLDRLAPIHMQGLDTSRQAGKGTAQRHG
jgi:hypothetical protein